MSLLPKKIKINKQIMKSYLSVTPFYNLTSNKKLHYELQDTILTVIKKEIRCKSLSNKFRSYKYVLKCNS